MLRRGLIAAGFAALSAAAIVSAWRTVERERTPTQCLDMTNEAHALHQGMVWVPGGDYTMGDTVYTEEGPPRKTHVKGFWMDRHEVSNRDFAAFVKATGYVTDAERSLDARTHPDIPAAMRVPGAMVFVMPHSVGDMSDVSQWWHFIPGANWHHPAGPGSTIVGHENFPVVEVTYDDARAYARWKGRTLPTEEEWEWAARGADPRAHPDHEQPTNANTWQGIFPVINSGEDGFVGLAPSGCYAPNRLGLYDMIGNVWEWTASVFTPDHSTAEGYPLAPDETPQPGAADTESYTIKGGSFLCAPNYCMRYRPGAREGQEADLGASHLGFRTILRTRGPSSPPR
jgi:formylglycine-generating enzyme required for sulfatase activity